MTKDEALQAVRSAADLARQHGASEDDIKEAAKVHPPYALPGLTPEGQKGAQFPGGPDALSGSKSAENPASVIDILSGKRQPK
jgi:hypothetical protein